MKKIVMIIMLAIAGASGVVIAQPKVISSDKTGWHKIGETTVDFKRDRDQIEILGANRFSRIKFQVQDEPIDLVTAEIFYDKGDNQTIQVNSHIKAPGYSREIDLNGGERDVKKIVFVYKTLPNPSDKKAHLEIWGLKTNLGTK